MIVVCVECDECMKLLKTEYLSEWAARRYAADRDWVRIRDGRDLCPECSPKGETR